MNAQEIFDTVVRHLKEQGVASATEGGVCRYRHTAPGGKTLKCAAGVLIPDDAYSSDMEGWSFPDVLEQHGERLPKSLHYERALIWELQALHDGPFRLGRIAELRDRLTIIANTEDLSHAVVDECFPEIGEDDHREVST